MSAYASIFADIASGNTNLADVMFLVGFILILGAAVLFYPRPTEGRPPFAHTVLCLGLAAVALGWLVL